MLSRRIASRLRDMETPFYLYDTELLRQTLESVVNESKRYNYKVHYAIKANYDDRLLAIIREYGLGVDCASIPTSIPRPTTASIRVRPTASSASPTKRFWTTPSGSVR